MISSTPSHESLLFLLLFSLSSFFNFSCSYTGNNAIFCPEIEKNSLLIFKQSLKDPYNLLSSWDGEVNCCQWHGVICNNSTGHVYELHLQASSNQFSIQGLSGKLNPSLLDLKHLKYLDLSLNRFSQTIPPFLGSFVELEYLSLSNAGFHGKIPHVLGNLSSLHSLNLESDYQLDVDSLEWLWGLSKLEYLNMNSVNLSRASNWEKVINTLPSLKELNLSDCSLEPIAPVHEVNTTSSLTSINLSANFIQSFAILTWILQLSHLVILDLSWNSFEGPIQLSCNATELQHVDLSVNSFSSTIPDCMYLSKDLEFLDLSGNLLNGTISSSVANLTSLKQFRLEYNYISGKIPNEIFKLCKVEALYVGFNNLEGDIVDLFGNMSDCFLGALRALSLGGNQFYGHLTHQFVELKSLEYVDLSFNSLSSEIPANLGKLTNLRTLDFYYNKFNGSLPESLGQLFNLEELYIDYNMLEGVVTESHFANLTNLVVFSASGNHLTLNITPNWVQPFFHLWTLKLGSWNLASIGSRAPSWLVNQTMLGDLDLSDTGISFSVPSFFWDISVLNLSHNYLHGEIPYLHGNQVYLSFNRFSGLVPRVGGHVAVLDLSNNSFTGGNHLTLNITPNWVQPFFLSTLRLRSWNLTSTGSRAPSWLVNQTNLSKLDLSDTGISFSVPRSFWDIQTLNLSHNCLPGEIPYLHGERVFLSSNRFSGLVPRVSDSVTELDLSNNSFTGGMSHFLCDITYETYRLQTLHFGGNQLTGELPDCWKRWPSLEYLNLGNNNNLFGSIPHSMGYLGELSSLNLNNNKLSAQLPFSLNNCTALEIIDLADNNLDGNIPAWVGTSLIHLRILILRSNKLSGNISSNICLLNSLQILDLSDNKVSGIIPRCVYNFTAMATKIISVEVPRIYFSGFYYSYIPRSIIDSASLVTKGAQRQYDTILPLVTNIDLSKNNLSGDIPQELASLVELRSLNLSENQLTGVIPNGIGDMKQLESLDLSMNSLSGQIPNSFTRLSSLAYLNLSFNKLTGKLPESTQISGFNGSSFIGNNLCGPPLTRDCSNIDGSTNQAHEHKSEGDHKGEVEWLYVFLSLHCISVEEIVEGGVFRMVRMHVGQGLCVCMYSMEKADETICPNSLSSKRATSLVNCKSLFDFWFYVFSGVLRYCNQ